MLELFFDRTTDRIARIIKEDREITMIEFLQSVIDKIKNFDHSVQNGGLNPEGLLCVWLDTKIIETFSLEQRSRIKVEIYQLTLRRKCLEKLIVLDMEQKKKYINEILKKTGTRLRYNEIRKLKDEF